MNLSKRLFIFVIFLFLSSLSFFSGKVYAVTGEGFAGQTPEQWAQAIDGNCGAGNDAEDTVCGEKYGMWSVGANANVFSRAIMGFPNAITPTPGVEGPLPMTPFRNSAVGFLAGGIDTMINTPPVSGIQYVAYVLENAGWAKPAYAQGVGYSGLRPVLALWRAMRNLAYVIIVIVLVVIGFMIMFRMQIDPQTVISVQSALPNIVVTLIVITFSYAIVGLLIDLMYFFILLIVSYLGSTIGIQGTNSISAIQSYYINANIGTLFGDYVFTEESGALPTAIATALPSGTIEWSENMSNPFFAFLAKFLGVVLVGVGGLIGGIVYLLIALSLLFKAVQIFMILLNSYIQIILGVIIAPIQLLVGAIPGQNTFRNWLFGIIGNLIVFPTLVAILMIANALTSPIYQEAFGDPAGSLWSPPFLFGQSAEAGPMLALLLFGLLMLTPTILSKVKTIFVPKPAVPIGPGMLFGSATGAAQTFLGLAQQRYYLRQQIQSKNPIVNTILGQPNK